MKKITFFREVIVNTTGLLAEWCNYFQFTGTFDFQIHRVEISLHQLPAQRQVRILHLSDFHASRGVPYPFLERAIEIGLAEQPDLICLTGDYVTHFIPGDPAEYRRILSRLPEAAPTFACFGNHDCCFPAETPLQYRDTLGVGQLLENAGITILHNRSVPLSVNGAMLQVAGLGDLASRNMHPEVTLSRFENARSEKVAVCCGAIAELPDRSEARLENAAGNSHLRDKKTANLPVILLSHNPDSKAFLRDYRWDVMLSGHSHGGQLRIPGIGAVHAPLYDKRFMEGLHRWENRWIYVTRGVGNVHGMRINCPPWVSIVTLSGA